MILFCQITDQNCTIIVILISNSKNHHSIIYIMIIQNNFNAHKSEIASHSWIYELDRFWSLFKDRDINHLQNIDDYFQKMKKIGRRILFYILGGARVLKYRISSQRLETLFGIRAIKNDNAEISWLALRYSLWIYRLLMFLLREYS